MNEPLTAIATVIAALGGAGWIFNFAWRAITGQRSTNQALAITGAAKVMVDELQEEVKDARAESRLAREETKAARAETQLARDETAAAREEIEILRRNISEMRRLTEAEIARLKRENAELLQRIANGHT